MQFLVSPDKLDFERHKHGILYPYCIFFFIYVFDLQHSQLSRSLTRQASDWILLKKQIAQFDEEYRWSQVSFKSTYYFII